MLKVTILLRATDRDSKYALTYEHVLEIGVAHGMYWLRGAEGTTRIPLDRIANIVEQPVPSREGVPHGNNNARPCE